MVESPVLWKKTPHWELHHAQKGIGLSTCLTECGQFTLTHTLKQRTTTCNCVLPNRPMYRGETARDQSSESSGPCGLHADLGRARSCMLKYSTEAGSSCQHLSISPSCPYKSPLLCFAAIRNCRTCTRRGSCAVELQHCIAFQSVQICRSRFQQLRVSTLRSMCHRWPHASRRCSPSLERPQVQCCSMLIPVKWSFPKAAKL